jgi:hypothetical protein
MVNDCDATISSGGLHATFVPEVVASIQGSSRIVELDLRSHNAKIRVVSDVLEGSGNGGDNPMSDKINEIDGRLRNVETDVSAMKVRLEQMPTTISMRQTMGGAALLTIAGLWAVLTFAGPGIMKTAVKDAVSEEMGKTPSAVVDGPTGPLGRKK